MVALIPCLVDDVKITVDQPRIAKRWSASAQLLEEVIFPGVVSWAVDSGDPEGETTMGEERSSSDGELPYRLRGDCDLGGPKRLQRRLGCPTPAARRSC